MGGRQEPLSLWGFSRTPYPALRPHPPSGRESTSQTYLDVLCVQILEVSQLPILQQPDFVRLTWRKVQRTLPVSECSQCGLTASASRPPQRHPGSWPGKPSASSGAPWTDSPVCLPPGWAKGTPGNTPHGPGEAAPLQFSQKQNPTRCSEHCRDGM